MCIRDRSEAASASADGNWGLSFQTQGQAPVGNATPDYLKDFNACYVDNTDEKVIYLTFDAGYENGNTEPILDALKKHNAPAAFFLVGNYLETSPDLVKRMADEGHIVGNHTYHHPDMSKISTAEAFGQELSSLEEKYQEITGKPMSLSLIHIFSSTAITLGDMVRISISIPLAFGQQSSTSVRIPISF